MGLWDVDKIEYVGRAKGPKEDFAFHYYDADKVVAGKKMKDWLRFGVAWWHTFNQELVDPFGTGTAHRPYYKYTDPMDQALAKVDYAFELFQKLGVEYFCFHDRDIAPEGDTLRETNANLDKVVDKIEENMKSTGVTHRNSRRDADTFSARGGVRQGHRAMWVPPRCIRGPHRRA